MFHLLQREESMYKADLYKRKPYIKQTLVMREGVGSLSLDGTVPSVFSLTN